MDTKKSKWNIELGWHIGPIYFEIAIRRDDVLWRIEQGLRALARRNTHLKRSPRNPEAYQQDSGRSPIFNRSIVEAIYEGDDWSLRQFRDDSPSDDHLADRDIDAGGHA